VADEQVFQQRINFLVLIAAQFRILVERKIIVPANFPGLEHCRHSRLAQPFVLFAHYLRPHGATFYNGAQARQRYFRTKVRSRRKCSPVSIFICLSGDRLAVETLATSVPDANVSSGLPRVAR
jgi:hypothetical protein